MQKAELALDYSIRKNASIPVKITWMRAGDPGWTVGLQGKADWNIGREAGQPYAGCGWATDFSCFRFAIPELCGFHGRAIYLDVDMVVLGDVIDLWQHDLRQPWETPGRLDVCVIDCAHLAPQVADWWPSLSHMKQSSCFVDHYARLLNRNKLLGKHISAQWDCRDSVPPGANLVHYTEMRTQPWKPWPERFRYPHRHPDVRAHELFWNTHEDACSARQNDTEKHPGTGSDVSYLSSQ